VDRFAYLALIDPIALAGTMEKITADGGNVVRLYLGDDGAIVSAVVTRREGLPAGEVDLQIRRRETP
jgi:hypothetical protein